MKQYEISIWEDVLIPKTDITPEYYKEEKIAIIGSDTMTSPCRAIEPRLVENVNGTNTLTFKMYYIYTDLDSGKQYYNPFLDILVNERKIKLNWKGKWYDFVIKGRVENSGNKSVTYTCKDLYINELSKTGFNLEFDDKLNNNQDTEIELAKKIVKGTDWMIDEGRSDLSRQFKEEPVYEILAKNKFTAVNEITKDVQVIEQGSTFLVFYSTLQNRDLNCQFVYASKYKTDINSLLVTDAVSCRIEINSYREEELPEGGTKIVAYIGSVPIFEYVKQQGVSNRYRAKKLVHNQKKVFEKALNRYVDVYTRRGRPSTRIYGYDELVFNDPTMVNNLLINSKNFAGTEGWIGDNLLFGLYPKFTSSNDLEYKANSYLHLTTGWTFNKGLRASSIYIADGFSKNETYIFRYKARNSVDSGSSYLMNSQDILPYIGDYTDGDKYTPVAPETNNYIDARLLSSIPAANRDNWVEFEVTFKRGLTRQDVVVKNIGFFVKSTRECWIEEIQFFKKILDEKETRINPGELDKQSVGVRTYKYYLPKKTYMKPEDIVYEYTGVQKWEEAIPTELEDFQKIRSISEKNSNRFNLLQTLAETFENWVCFEIQHEANGSTKVINGKPQKFIYFKEQIGEEVGTGFIYGIDLKTISRTVNSDKITTKVIVSPNSNEFAQDGFCTIARSKENYTSDNFILNFDYYISQQLMDGDKLNYDLYSSDEGSLGYYFHLHQWNTQYDELTKKLINKKIELTKQEAFLKVYNETVTSIDEEITSVVNDICTLAGVKTIEDAQKYFQAHPDNDAVKVRLLNYKNLKNNAASYREQRDKLEKSLDLLKKAVEETEKLQKDIRNKLEDLNAKFYNKYSRFIQEGSWISDKYIDDNLYYLDALSVAYTSSRPQISYDISVIRLDAIEEYKNKKFRLGDISYIQDPEFFGYSYIDQIKTPNKEKVLISEIVSYLDSPEKDSFKVQNYKTEFEDLFQKITATTQSLQYHTGEYKKASNAFDQKGAINPETLQTSIDLNNNLVFSSQNETIRQDNTGITLSDTSNPNKKTKITSGGLFISVDGGVTWKNAIRGEGVATQYLTAGAINVNNITIYDGNFSRFRWDKSGINAYHMSDAGLNLAKFVRFDHYGIYGIDGYTNENDEFVPKTINDIKDHALFGLTWDGFFIKNKYGRGQVEISSESDIEVIDENKKQRIKIGNIATGTDKNTNPIFGIRISNQQGAPILETNNIGELWLKDSLKIGTTSGRYNVAIGNLESKHATHGSEVFNANNNFIVYEDGSMLANDGTFTGTIYADKGTIGGLSIEGLKDTIGENQGIKIKSNTGLIFKTNAKGQVTPKTITLEAILKGITVTDESTIKWSGSGDLTSWTPPVTGKQFIVDYEKIKASFEGGLYYVKVECTVNQTVYQDIVVITEITDGSDGKDGASYRIDTNQDNVFKFHTIYTESETAPAAQETSSNVEVKKLVFSPASLEISGYKQGNPNTLLIDKKIELSNTSGIQVDVEINVIREDGTVFSFITETNPTPNTNIIELLGKHYHIKQDFVKTEPDAEGQLVPQPGHYVVELQDFIEETFPDNSNAQNLQNILKGKSALLQISYILDSQKIVVKAVSIDFGTSEDMARLNIYANGIVAALQDTSLRFDATGLTLTAGDFTIKDKNGNQVLGADKDGNLEISGKLKAATGTFTGELIAPKGTIGGFTIETSRLVSKQNGDEPPVLILNGETGEIIANDIRLGSKATIEDKIILGTSATGVTFIGNPKKNDRVFLKSTNLELRDDGKFKLGTLQIDGETASLRSSEFNPKWEINGDGTARFDTLKVKTALIGASIFEQNSVQASSSTILLKESSYVKDINVTDTGTQFTLESDILLQVGDSVLLSYNGKTQLATIISIVDSIVTVNILLVGAIDGETLLVKIGSHSTPNQYIVSLSGAITDTNNGLTNPTSFTIKELVQPNGKESGNIAFKDRLVLGDLKSLGLRGFGLYGENVYLTGSLITKTATESGHQSYAGVNTLDGVKNISFGTNDTSEIIFWAGAKDSTPEAIQKAMFLVTRNGSIYAQQGKFTGTIISDSYIQASKLYATEIYGGTEDNSIALKIYDTKKGILFCHKESSGDKVTLEINENGLVGLGKEFIKIQERNGSGLVSFLGEEAVINEFKTNKSNETDCYLSIKEQSIRLIESKNFDTEKFVKNYIKFEKNNIKLGFFNDQQQKDNLIIEEQETKMTSTKTTLMNQVIIMGEEGKTFMEYKKVEQGFDLYVSDSRK